MQTFEGKQIPRGREFVLAIGAAAFCGLAYVAGQAMGWWV